MKIFKPGDNLPSRFFTRGTPKKERLKFTLKSGALYKGGTFYCRPKISKESVGLQAASCKYAGIKDVKLYGFGCGFYYSRQIDLIIRR